MIILPKLAVRWLVTASAAFTCLTCGCGELSSEPDPPFDPDAASQTIGGTRITWTQSGTKSAVIESKTLICFQNRDVVVLRDSVRVYLYDEDGTLAAIVNGSRGTINERDRTADVDSGIVVRFKGSQEYRASTLTADKAFANDRSKEMTASGGVVIENEKGVRLETDMLMWDGRRRRFRAPGFVRITNGTEVEEGIQLDANADLTEWTMQQVSGRSTRPAEEIREKLGRQLESSQQDAEP